MSGSADAADLSIGLVAARWNDAVVTRLIDGAIDAVVSCGGRREAITCLRVPGAFEIPLAAQALAASGRVHAVVCLGCLVRGQTVHFETLARDVTAAMTRIALTTGVPVAHGVLAVEDVEQALERCGGAQGNKGAEAALAAIELANLLRALRGQRG